MLVKVKNFLTEGGYLEKNKAGYKIIKPIIDLAVIDEIKEHSSYRNLLGLNIILKVCNNTSLCIIEHIL